MSENETGCHEYYREFSAKLEPYWRWQEADRQSFEPYKVFDDDPYIKAAVFYLKEDHKRGRFYSGEVYSYMSDVFAHYRDYDSAMLLEAAILAFRDLSAVAEYVHKSHRFVQVYSKMFFDVVPRIGATRWIDARVIKNPWYEQDRVRQTLFHSCYFAGEFALRRWHPHLPFIDKSIEHDLSDPVGRERESLELELLFNRIDPGEYRDRVAAAFDAEIIRKPPLQRVSSLFIGQCDRLIERQITAQRRAHKARRKAMKPPAKPRVVTAKKSGANKRRTPPQIATA